MDWTQLKNEYNSEFLETKISLRDWCHKKNIKYNTARRHIKVQQLQRQHNPSADNTNCASVKSGLVRSSHNGYSQFIDEKYVNAAKQIDSLHHELTHARSILAHQSDRLLWFNEQMTKHNEPKEIMTLFKAMCPLYDLIDRSMGRIASIELSIARLEHVQTSKEKDKAQTELLLQTLQQRRLDADKGQVTFNINW